MEYLKPFQTSVSPPAESPTSPSVGSPLSRSTSSELMEDSHSGNISGAMVTWPSASPLHEEPEVHKTEEPEVHKTEEPEVHKTEEPEVHKTEETKVHKTEESITGNIASAATLDASGPNGPFYSKPVKAKLKIKKLLNPNHGKNKLWYKLVIVKAGTEIVHCKLTIFPSITNPHDGHTYMMLGVIAQLSEAQCRVLESGQDMYKIKVRCEASADRQLESPEAFLVPFKHKNGQLRYFQPLMPQHVLEECTNPAIELVFTVELLCPRRIPVGK